MKWLTRRIIAVVVGVGLCGAAISAEQGILRVVDADHGVLTIDELALHTSPQLRVNNLGTGLNELGYAIVGQPVRYTLDTQGRIDELWLYPLRADDRQRLGVHLEGEEQ